MSEQSYQEASKQKFIEKLQKTTNKMQRDVLDILETSLGSKGERYEIARAKMIRACQNSVRLLSQDLLRYYVMDFICDTEEVIVFQD